MLTRLRAGAHIERHLELNESHHYVLALERGHALHAKLLQKNLDVLARLLDPGGHLQLVVDGPNGPHGFETIAFLAEQTGDYVLQIEAYNRTTSGDYELRVLALAAPDDEHRQRSRAVADFAAAERLRVDGAPAALARMDELYAGACRDFERCGERILQARCERRRGQLRLQMRRLKDAAVHMEAARELYRQDGEDWEKAPLYNDLGQIYRLDGAPERARWMFQQARRTAEASGNRQALAGAYNNLGVVAAEQGEIQVALTAYEKTSSLWRELGDEAQQAIIEHNIGVYYLDLGRPAESLPFLHQALVLKRRSRDRSQEALTLAALGWAYHRLDDEAAALEHYGQALVQLDPADTAARATVLDRLGTVYFERQRYREAFLRYQEAVSLVGEGELERAYIELNLGAVELVEEHLGAAAASFAAALAVFNEHGVLQGQADALAMLSRVAREERRFDAAIAYLERSLELVESIRGQLQSQWLRNAYLAGRYDQYRDQVELLMELEHERPGQGYARRALEASQRARGRGIAESLTEALAKVRETAAPELIERERVMRAQINALERRRLEMGISPIEVRSIDKQLNDRLLEYERLQGQLRARHPEALDRVEAPSLEEIQEHLLDAESLMLVYFLGRRESYLWAISKDAFTVHTLPAGAEIDELARRLRVVVPQQHLPGFQAQAQQVTERLSRMLLEPVTDRLAGQHLIFIPDGALQIVPFAYLRHPSLVETPLLRRHTSTVLPSLSMLPLIRRKRAERAQRKGELAIVFDAVVGSNDPRLRPVLRAHQGGDRDLRSASRWPPIDLRLPRLPFAEKEAAAILSMTSGETLAVGGFEATREWVLEAPLEDYRIVHFATHAILDHRHPALSAIVLSLWDETGEPKDGFLRVHELFDLRLNADLVVLSACSTALGQEIRGEGLVGLTHGFFYAGAASALVSLWPIDDEATADFMTAFYAAMLGDGLPAASALRRAQLVMSEHPRWSAPRHWAGFVLVGEWE